MVEEDTTWEPLELMIELHFNCQVLPGEWEAILMTTQDQIVQPLKYQGWMKRSKNR